jgi:photosystem II stability/assembly factor-like uncharacterized protein
LGIFNGGFMQRKKYIKNVLYISVFSLIIILVTVPVYNCGGDDLLNHGEDTTQTGSNNGYVTYWAETTDGGFSWDPLDSNYNSDIKYVYAGAQIASVSGSFLMCGKDTLDRPAIWKSTDYGVSWSLVHHTSGGGSFIKMNINTLGSSILAITNNGSVVRSSDNGDTWSDVSFPNVVSAIDYNPTSGRWVAVGSFGLAMYSDDGGVSWIQGSGVASVGLDDVCFVENSLTIVAITETSVYRSSDGGVNYELVENTSNSNIISISSDGKGIILNNNNNPPYYTTTNAGLNWIAGPISSSATAYNDVVMFDSTLILATKMSGIVYSTDMGENWNSTGISKEMYEINRPDRSTWYAFVLGR